MKNNSRQSREDTPLRPLLRRIYPAAAVMTAVSFGISCIRGASLGKLLGFLLGYGYMCFCYEYLARTCERAVVSEKARAVRMMRVCYGIRFAGLFALCAAAALTGLADMTGILLVQFFPRIILMFIQTKDNS